MKTFSKLLTLAVLAMTSLTSCEDILGHWERPTAATDSTPTPAPDPAPTPASEELATPLTLEAVSGTVTVTIKTDFTAGKPIEYSTDDGATWTVGTPSLGGGADIDHCENPVTITGSKIMLRGTNAAYGYSGETGGTPIDLSTRIGCDADCYIYGNVMSLIDKDNFATLTAFDTAQGTYAFYHLFHGNTHIKNHSEKQLLLPAMTLAEGCYYSMFIGCTSLTTAPTLPAENLAKYCYSEMFGGCTSLTTTPMLPAKNLALGCYIRMFKRCDNLTTAPALPAENLEIGCYLQMFQGCKNLTTAPALPATTLTVDCYNSMFENCIGLTTAYVKAAYTTTGDACKNMFNGCTAGGVIHTASGNEGGWNGTFTGWTADGGWTD